jgi:hypothetical protein
MEAFVGGVYGEKGFAVILSKDQALVNGKLILRNGDVYITPKGIYTDNHGVYSCPKGIVSRNGDIFAGSTGIRYGYLEMFFLDLVGQPLYLEVQVPACVSLNPAQT